MLPPDSAKKIPLGNTKDFSPQSGEIIQKTVWNGRGKTLSQGAPCFCFSFLGRFIPRNFNFTSPTHCPLVSHEDTDEANNVI